ncbi:MAG TPA: Vms1/Ankzf1 family peptidyl-tRNA hydrolase [Gaiellaceae bacterium]|nr:Vms1/Ankzf1 family peptidyl-tRNA hydrolase [Gaiellaceae bacterium]
MARTVSWEELRDLAGFEAENGIAISVYLDLDPSVVPTAGDAQTRLHSLLDGAAKENGGKGRELTHQQRLALRDDLDRIRRYFEAEFERDGAHGLAIFCAGLDNVWRPLPLTEVVPDGIKVGQLLYLAPLVPLVGRGEGALVLVVSREQGRFYRLRAGRLEDLADYFEEQPRRHDQGGWAQARLQRRADELVHEHIKRVAEELDRFVRRLRKPQVVVVTNEEVRGEFEDLLSQDVRSVIAGFAHADAHAQPPELLAVTAPVLERWQAARETEVVDRWMEELGRNGRAASGWQATLEAASDARIELLLFRDGANHPAKRCPACGRLSVDGAKCPLDGRQLVDSADGLDLAVHQTLAHGGRVWAVRHRDDLDAHDGIGALLRF